MIIVKKYSNRRLYDTTESSYITLDDLAVKIRGGEDVRVVDAKTGEDLTQGTLAQIIIESRGAGRLLPVPLLFQLIRMENDALAEFFGQYVSMALEFYLQMRKGAQQVSPWYPMVNAPFTMANAMARMFMGQSPWAGMNPWQGGAPGPWGGGPQVPPHATPPVGWPSSPPPPPPPPEPEPDEEASNKEELAALRRELEALKEALTGK